MTRAGKIHCHDARGRLVATGRSARKIKEPLALATASHQLLPLCCSAFLRPSEAFAALKAWVIEDLLDRAMAARPVRIWIPACGTGEEAYCLAIVLLEHFASYGRELNVRIFATDRDANSIAAAQAGVYAESDLSQLTAVRLQRFFQRQGPDRYRVSAPVRDCIEFAKHDLEHDPPLEHLDFVTFRNIGSDIEPQRRARVYALLHSALNEGGLMLLDPGEGPPVPPASLFQPVAAQGYVYRRVADSSAAAPHTLFDSAAEELLAATNIAILLLDAQLRIERFTAAAATLLNLCDGDLGRPWSALARGFDEQLSIDAQLTIETRTPIEKNVRGPHHRCYLRRVQVFRAEGERVGGVVVTFVDITRQVESDAQLRRFAAMLRDSADAIVVMDFGGRIVAWNRGAQRLYGYTQAEALKLNVRDLMTGDRLDSTLEVMRRVARGEAMPAFDTQRRTRDGRLVDVSATVALLFDVAGNPESLAATERDITARRRAEDETRMLNARLEQRVAERATELQHSEEQIRAILDATADAVVTIDILGRVATFNRAAERIFGYAASEVIGENVTMLIPPQERVGRYGYKATATRSYASRLIGRSHEISGRRKDGSIFPIQLSVNSVEGRGLFVGVARDMTEHKALQKEIIDVAMLEQRRIGQELHDGTQQELTGLGLLAQSLAESLSRSNAMTASQVASRVARGIEQCNQRVRSLARGMVPVPIDREGLMAALAELARQTTEIHGIPCGFECPSLVEIDNDNEATHLYRIAQEAVSNATRHAKASAIWIRLEQVDGRLLLEVQDTGIGLQAAANSGKGVGLRLMEHRCAIIGGNFAIEPRPDGGTCIACSVLRPEEPRGQLG
jgi:PAS domain S-box-containing protein